MTQRALLRICSKHSDCSADDIDISVIFPVKISVKTGLSGELDALTKEKSAGYVFAATCKFRGKAESEIISRPLGKGLASSLTPHKNVE